jgi:hypothetical protein
MKQKGEGKEEDRGNSGKRVLMPVNSLWNELCEVAYDSIKCLMYKVKSKGYAWDMRKVHV